MRRALLLAVLLLAACGDNFYSVQQADTIEAYESYLQQHPNSRFDLQAKTRLEELYLDKAKASKRLEGYDEYLKKFPDGVYHDKAMKAREDFLFQWAKGKGTVDAWKKYLDEYPHASNKRKKEAHQAMAVAAYAPSLELSDVRSKRVNLAENPDGPLDGWELDVDVKNKGDRTVSFLSLEAHWDGEGIGHHTWPVVAPTWPIPMEDAKKVPIKPGETRTWVWTTNKIPADYKGSFTVQPTAVAFVGDD